MKIKRIKRILILVALLILACAFQKIRGSYRKRPENLYNGTIPVFHSSIDCDEDGIDDQEDVLQGALDYVAGRPLYRSKYYQSGYPDDHYGVCTDVVAMALKNAGYDLRIWVNEDIMQSPDSYAVDTPDINIDFRRVQNLNVFFARNAITLTTDLKEVTEWQGGDIVVFEDHIGIVSDRRNENGIPYVIHHYTFFQKYYEQDILEERDDLIGHYRISE